MKKLLYISFFLFSVANVFSQGDDSLYVKSVVEEMPEYPGGMANLMRFLQENINYPVAARDKGIMGKVFTKFVIDTSGGITNIQVLRSSGSSVLDSEAVRVVSIMPKWKPGKQNGKSVPVYFNLPIKFSLGTTYDWSPITFRSSYGYTTKKSSMFFDTYGNAIVLPNDKYKRLPSFVGGIDSLENFVKKNILIDEKKIQGKAFQSVLVKFAIMDDGLVSEVKVAVSSKLEYLDDEAVRIVKLFPKWEPAIKEGKAIKTYCKLQINFNSAISKSVTSFTNESYSSISGANYYYNLGVKAVNENKMKDAIHYFEECLKIDNRDIDAMYNKAVVFLELNQMEDACVELNKIKSLGKNDGEDLRIKYCANKVVVADSIIDTNQIYTVVQKMPTYPGGIDKLNEFINQNFDATKRGTEYKHDKVFVKFVIATNGDVKNAEILRGSGNEKMDKEALRVVNLIKGWIPGEQNGTKVKVYFNLPIKVV